MTKMNRIVLIGQAPGRSGDPARPLIGGASGTKLMMLTGLSFNDYVRAFERRNVFDRWMGESQNGKGDLFPMPEARARAAEIVPELSGRRVIFVGAAVAAAFGAQRLRFFEWRSDLTGFEASVIPHPSPVNRFWNDPENVATAREFFERALAADKSEAR